MHLVLVTGENHKQVIRGVKVTQRRQGVDRLDTLMAQVNTLQLRITVHNYDGYKGLKKLNLFFIFSYH